MRSLHGPGFSRKGITPPQGGVANEKDTPQRANCLRLFNYTGSLTDNGLDVLLTNLPELAKDLHYEVDTTIASQVDLLIGVPEPASLLLISFSLPWLLRRRRRPHHA